MRALLLAMAALVATACGPSFTQVYESHLLPPYAQEGTAPALTAVWMGTAGILLSDGETDLLIDPYVSRYGLFTVGFKRDLPIETDVADAWLARMQPGNVPYVFVSHSHYDHAMDAPYFAQKLNAVVVGSESTANIARGMGLPETQMRVVKDRAVFTAGKFRLTILRSEHGKALFGRIPYPGTIDEPLTPPASVDEYRLGEAYSILIEHPRGTVLHHASAGIVPGMFEGIQADTVLLGIAGRADTESYLRDVVDAVGARRVIPFHFDDFFVPLDEPMEELWFVDFREFMRTTAEIRPQLTIETMPIGVPVRMDSPAAR